MQELIYCLVIVLTVLAIICIVKMLINTFLYKKGQLLCVFTIIPVTENKKDIEYTVRSLLWEKRWDEKTEQFIILVIINCDNETIQICKKLCEEYVITSYSIHYTKLYDAISTVFSRGLWKMFSAVIRRS